MINIKNGVYKSTKIDWDNITFPLKAGTPVSLNGAVANTSSAMGIVPTTYQAKPLMEEIYVLVGGDVIQAECEESWGNEYTDDAFAAMDGIRFYTEDGTPVDCACGGGGSGSGGGVFVLFAPDEEGIKSLNKKSSEIVAAYNAGKIILLMEESGYLYFGRYQQEGGSYSFSFSVPGSTGEALFIGGEDDYPTLEVN